MIILTLHAHFFVGMKRVRRKRKMRKRMRRMRRMRRRGRRSSTWVDIWVTNGYGTYVKFSGVGNSY